MFFQAQHLFDHFDRETAALQTTVVKQTLQDPFIYLSSKEYSDKDMQNLLVKDERFRGIMEFYHIFRGLIALTRAGDPADKAHRFSKMHRLIAGMTQELQEVKDA